MTKHNRGAHGAKKKRNKAYKPYQSKFGVIAGGVIALAANQERAENVQDFLANMHNPYTEDEVSDLARAYWMSFERLKLVDATEEAWSNVCASLNMAALLCERGIGEEHIPTMNRALVAIFKAKQRGERTGSFRLDGEGLTAVSEALQVHDEQMKVATPFDITRADDEQKKRFAAGNIIQPERLH